MVLKKSTDTILNALKHFVPEHIETIILIKTKKISSDISSEKIYVSYATTACYVHLIWNNTGVCY